MLPLPLRERQHTRPRRAEKVGAGFRPQKGVWLPLAASQTLCLPHPWVGKIALRPVAADGPRWCSAQRREAAFLFYLFLLSFSTETSKSCQNRLVSAGRGTGSAPPAIAAHSGAQAVMRGFPAPAGVSQSAVVSRSVPAWPAAADKMYQTLAGWMGRIVYRLLPFHFIPLSSI